MLFQSVLAVLLLFQACSAGLVPRITDGQTATPGEFPYQVSVNWGIPPLLKYRHVCGGSIISKNYVLTAGHCILRLGKLRIVAGKHVINKVEDTEQTIQVEKAIVHEKYKGGVNPYDIAILKLASPLEFNDRVAPLKIAKKEKPDKNAVLSGWGSVSKRLLPVLPTTLQKGEIPIIDNESCLKQLNSVKTIFGKKAQLFDTQICTGVDDSGLKVSACSGDSGGPLVQFGKKNIYQIGVVSWGMYPCGSGMPSVYTRVSSYYEWIREHTNNEALFF